MIKSYFYALDLSLNSTGVCIFDDGKNFVEAITIDTTREKNTPLKLKIIADELIRLMDKYNPKIILIEQGFTRYNKSTQQLFRVHGLANYLFWEYEQVYYPSSTIKKIVGGKGNMSKDELRKIIKLEHPDVTFTSYDESDAFALAKTHFITAKVNYD